MKWHKSFREQSVECENAGNRFLVEVPEARGFFKPKPGFAAIIPACSIIVCVQFKTYCHSAVCRDVREKLHCIPKNEQNLEDEISYSTDIDCGSGDEYLKGILERDNDT